MAISIRATGAYVSGTGNLSPLIPAGATAGDLMLLAHSGKPFNVGVSVNQSWTQIGSATDGTVNAGVDVGSMRTSFWYKIHTGTETNPTVTITGGNVTGAVIIVFQKAANLTWDFQGTGGGDATADTTFSATGASILDITANDMIVAAAGFRSDAANPGAISVTATGATIGTLLKSPATDLNTTAGGDMDMTTGYALCSAGTATAAPVFSSTLGAAHTGTMFLVRLREIDFVSSDPMGMMGFFGV